MDPSRKRTVRLVVALSAAVLLAAALVFTTFSSSSEAVQPNQLAATAVPGKTYELTGTVVDGSVRKSGDAMTFSVQDRKGSAAVPVTYTGQVPDPFRDGREIIVTVQKDGSRFVGQRDSLVTKCPSKYQAS